MTTTQVTFEQAIQIALRQYDAGQIQQSEAICRQLLAHDPNRADALHLLGLIANRAGHPDAVPLLRRAIALVPNNAIAWANLAIVLQGQSRWDEAMECSRQALALQPNIPQAHFNLGYAFHAKGELENAVACYQRAIALQPGNSLPYLNLGAALRGLGRIEQAADIYRRGLQLEMNSAPLLSNLGEVLYMLGRHEESLACCRQAIAIDPNMPEAHLNLGNALVGQKQFAEAIESFRGAIALRPEYPDAHTNLAMALLTVGQFEAGWREHEWRWRKPNFPSPQRHFSQPQWDGSDLNGRTILLHGEQGLGDAIQFVRFSQQVHRRGGRIVIECKPELLRLFQNAVELGAEAIVVQSAAGTTPAIAFDVHCPLMSLPLALGIFDAAKIPSQIPYLHADKLSEEHWREALSDGEKQLKVGIAWTGTSLNANDQARSIALETLAPLARKDVRFYSLQLGGGVEEAQTPPAGMELIDLTSRIGDFADSAGLISQLDLVICVDSDIAHLAGAMGKPVWVMLADRSDYRWLLDREDSPWYPTMRLFRQQFAGDWEEVVERISKALDAGVESLAGPREN